jgi:hypothetical protein
MVQIDLQIPTDAPSGPYQFSTWAAMTAANGATSVQDPVAVTIISEVGKVHPWSNSGQRLRVIPAVRRLLRIANTGTAV